MSCRSDPPGWWRDVPGTGGKYQCSKNGEVRRVLKHGRTSPLRPYLLCRSCHPKNRRQHVHLTVNSKSQIVTLMSVIVRTWLPPAPEGMVYHHANGNTHDWRLSNIQLIDRRELGKKTGGRATHRCVEKIDRDGNIVELYTSARAAAKAENMSHESIRQRCNGKIKAPYALTGYTYRWEKE